MIFMESFGCEKKKLEDKLRTEKEMEDKERREANLCVKKESWVAN